MIRDSVSQADGTPEWFWKNVPTFLEREIFITSFGSKKILAVQILCSAPETPVSLRYARKDAVAMQNRRRMLTTAEKRISLRRVPI